MEGSNLTRLGRVLGYLATHPQHVPFYFTSGPFSKKGPLQHRLPWFSLAAIRFLDSFVTRSMRVFEYGSGGSTVYFAHRAKEVITTEDNQMWLERVQTELDAAGLANATLQYRPYDFRRAENFEGSDYLRSIPDGKFDVIVVDGIEEGTPMRPRCFHYAESHVAPGGVILVDDSWKYTELRSSNRAKSFQVFRSIGPARAGVTSTDVYFY